MMRKRNSDVLLETLELAGRTVIDIGCGDGGLTRLMARNGAHVLGVEVSPRQLAKAQAAAPVADERFVAGRAEELPAPDGAADIVIFFNSLHHVPVEGQDKAIAEAARALKPGGLLYVSEPVAEGPLFELIKPIDDETEIRAHAYRMLQDSVRRFLRLPFHRPQALCPFRLLPRRSLLLHLQSPHQSHQLNQHNLQKSAG